MKTTWRYKDLIDLEYFFHTDEPAGGETPANAAALRDREIYVRDIMPQAPDGEAIPGRSSTPLPRRWILREWLKRRREILKSTAPEIPLPGEAFDEIYRLLIVAAVVTGVMTGGGLAFSLLRYAGTSPVNVSVYLSMLVGTQLLLIAFLAACFLVRLLFRRKPPFSLLYTLVSSLLVMLMLRISRAAERRMSGRGRSSLEAIFGLIRGKRLIYGSLFYWPFFALTQMFGISFNGGVLGATLLLVLGTDIAFGWQSSILFSADLVYRAVETIALPWSWFIPPGIAHPTLAQIEGSHMILKDGIYHLATQDLVSWWPFLCLTVVFYGLVPRLILYIAVLFFQSRALAGLDFSHSRADQLVQRMRTPLLDTGAAPPAERPEEAPPAEPSPETQTSERSRPAALQPDLLGRDRLSPDEMPIDEPSSEAGLVALIPDDIFEDCPQETLESLTCRVFGFRIREAVRMGEDDMTDQTLLARLSEAARENGQTGFFILKEAWQPPIREEIAFIRHLRKAAGGRARIQIGLIGKPASDTIFTRVEEKDWNIWHQKITSLGDPYLRLERLVTQ